MWQLILWYSTLQLLHFPFNIGRKGIYEMKNGKCKTKTISFLSVFLLKLPFHAGKELSCDFVMRNSPLQSGSIKDLLLTISFLSSLVSRSILFRLFPTWNFLVNYPRESNERAKRQVVKCCREINDEMNVS